MEEEMDQPYKYFLMGNITLDILSKTYSLGKGFTIGIVENTILDSFNLAKKLGVVFKVKFSIKESLNKTNAMEKELVGTQRDKYIQDIGLREKDMAMAQ